MYAFHFTALKALEILYKYFLPLNLDKRDRETKSLFHFPFCNYSTYRRRISKLFKEKDKR